jgi:hypothetical protein
MSVFVITCSVPAALELSSGGYDILLLGGIVRNKSLALLGRETLTILERYRADKAFLGSSGFTAKRGHSTPNPDDAQIKEAIMRTADETYVLVDSSKYGPRLSDQFCAPLRRRFNHHRKSPLAPQSSDPGGRRCEALHRRCGQSESGPRGRGSESRTNSFAR